MTPVRMKSYAVVLLLAWLTACSGSADARRDKFLARGKDLLKKQEYSRAILEFRNAVQAKPKDAEVYCQIGMAYSGLQDFRSAVSAFRKAIQLNPKHFEAQLRLAQIFALTDDKELLTQAQSRLKTLLEESAGNTDVLNTLAFTEIRLGHPDIAMKGLEQALERSPGILSTSVLLASAKLSQNDLKGAEDVLKKASDDAPNSSEAHKVLADFYIDRNRMSDAETHLRRALELDPKNEAALMDLARLQLTLGKKQEAEQGFKRLAASFNYRSVYGIFLFQDGRRDEAVREFEKLFKENPEDRAARTRLIVAYRVMNRPADVDRVVQAALKKNSRDLEAMLEWSEILIERGKFSDAETNLNLALKMNRTSPEVHYLFAKLNQARGSTLLYRQELAEALRLNPSLEAVRVELAADYTNNNDGHSARDLVDAAPESQRLSMPLLIQRNWAVWNMGDLAGMRQGIDRGLAQERSPELLIQDGLCRLKSGDPVSARKSLEEALKLNPEDLRALSLLNRTYLVEKNVPMALKKVAEYAAQQPKSAPVQDYLGVLLMVDGDRAQARSAFSAALAADPKFAPAEFSMVQIEVSEGKVNEARNRLAAILAKDKFNVTARRWLGNIEVMRGDTNAAIEHYQQVVSASPSDPQALNNLAYLLTEYRNQHDEALKYAQRAVELAPQRPAYCDTLGWVLYRKGLYTPAIKYLEIATTSKETVVSRYHLAMAYAKSGDLVRGKATLAAALKANPNVPEAKLAQQVVGESR